MSCIALFILACSKALYTENKGNYVKHAFDEPGLLPSY